LHTSVEEFDLCPLNTQFRKCVWRKMTLQCHSGHEVCGVTNERKSAPDSRSCAYFVRSVCTNGHVHPRSTPMNTPEQYSSCRSHTLHARCDTASNVIFPPHTLSKLCVLGTQIEFLDTLVQGGWRPHAPGWRARSGGTQDRGSVVRELHTPKRHSRGACLARCSCY
jgi:hypothetical protein